MAEPSQADELITQRVKEALALVDIRLLDHIIVGEGVSVSLAERGLVECPPRRPCALPGARGHTPPGMPYAANGSSPSSSSVGSKLHVTVSPSPAAVDPGEAEIIAVTGGQLQKTEVDTFTAAVPGAVHVSV